MFLSNNITFHYIFFIILDKYELIHIFIHKILKLLMLDYFNFIWIIVSIQTRNYLKVLLLVYLVIWNKMCSSLFLINVNVCLIWQTSEKYFVRNYHLTFYDISTYMNRNVTFLIFRIWFRDSSSSFTNIDTGLNSLLLIFTEEYNTCTDLCIWLDNWQH